MKPNIVHIETFSPGETVIQIAGIRKSLTLLHITDSHLTEADERDEEAVREGAKRRQGVIGGQAQSHFETAIRRSNEWEVDCTVFTGDIVDFPSARNIELMQRQFDQLRAPYLYTLGNHDWRFPHLRPSDGIRADVYPLFERVAGDNPSHQALDLEGVRLIAMDNSNYQISPEQLDFMKAQLAGNMPCLLFFHIPLYIPTLAPKVDEVWKAPIMVDAKGWDEKARQKWGVREADDSTKAFRRLVTSGEGDNLAAIFCGHVHFSHQDSFAPGRYQYITQPGFGGGYRKITLEPLQ